MSVNIPIRLILVGGFLGAGKTTLLLAAAQQLTKQGYRVGLITNDQGEDLVDTAFGRGQTIPVTEVAGGCFCCRFPDLLAALARLKEVADPHVILAEAVGSCTDLVATVVRPLIQFHPEQYTLAPLTILHDGVRNLTTFSDDVAYLYHQQLAEAELLLLNKCDQLGAAEEQTKRATLEVDYPSATILTTAAQTGVGIDRWLAIVLGEESRNPEALVIDYERYAKAEAALGWLNVKGQIRSDEPFDATQWTTDLLNDLANDFAAQQATIAHIKIFVSVDANELKASLTQQGGAISWDSYLANPHTPHLDFLLNVRVNATPQQLEAVVTKAIDVRKPSPAARYYFTHFECFSPLPPKPTYRL